MNIMKRRSLAVGSLCAFIGSVVCGVQSLLAGTPLEFTPLTASAPCVAGGTGSDPNEQPFVLPAGFTQTVLAREGDGGTTDNWDMNTLNETGPQAGRFLYRTHETLTNGQLSVTDLETGLTSVLVDRADWNRMDGIVWTPWRTLLVAEEMRPERLPSTPDPDFPEAQAGLVYEVDPLTGDVDVRPHSARRLTRACVSIRRGTSTAFRRPHRQRAWAPRREMHQEVTFSVRPRQARRPLLRPALRA